MKLLQGLPKRIAVVAIGLLVLEILLVLWVSVPWLVGRVNADDFYYYLVLARNNAAGYGPSFDGVELTNGFHPLYLVFVTLLAMLPVTDPAFLIKSSLILLLIFHNLTGVVIGGGFKLRGRADIGEIMALAWLLNPWSLAITLHGVEAPIATFLWVMVIFGLIFYRQKEQKSIGQATGLGVVIGFAILARTDSLLLLGAILLAELYRAWRNPAGRRQIVLGVVAMGGGAFLVTLPWWWWNWQTFDMILQVSSKAIFLGTHGFDWLKPELILAQAGRAGQGYLSRVILYSVLPLLLLGLGFWQYQKGRYQGRFSAFQFLSELDFALLTIIGLGLWYPGWQWNVQNWYLLSTIAVITIGVGLVWQQLTQKQGAIDMRQPAGLLVFTSLLLLVGFSLTTGFGYPRQERGYHLAQWLNRHTEPEAVIGAWNSGIIGYFAERSVVNLDGVVNNSLYHYKLARRTSDVLGLMDYIRSRRITYLTDYENFYIGEPQEIGLKLTHDSSEYGFRVYRLDLVDQYSKIGP